MSALITMYRVLVHDWRYTVAVLVTCVCMTLAGALMLVMLLGGGS